MARVPNATGYRRAKSLRSTHHREREQGVYYCVRQILRNRVRIGLEIELEIGLEIELEIVLEIM